MSWFVAGVLVGSFVFSLVVVRVFIMPLMRPLPADPSDYGGKDDV